ncbi:MAG: S8 family peptidase [Actinomycetota bacterium]
MSLSRAVASVKRRGLARVVTVAAASMMALASIGGSAFGAAAPSDYFYANGLQWGMTRIKVTSAWDGNPGRGAGVTVALIDTGLDVSHVDLQGQFLGGMDYVDGGTPEGNHWHGTMMAGIVAAKTDNGGVGVAGIAPGAKILPVRWVERDGNGLKGDPADAAAGIRWAVQNAPGGPGKLVVVLGWDWTGSQGSMGPVKSIYQNGAVQDAIRFAAQSGAVVVLAAGNSNDGAPAYNPNIPGTVVVGATTEQDGLASGANSGAPLLAPGHNIFSTNWHPQESYPCPQRAADCPAEQRTYESIYGLGHGTSLAAAHVSGVAALMLSKGGVDNASLVSKLIETGEKLGSSKLVDAAGALNQRPKAETPPPPPPPGDPAQTPPPTVDTSTGKVAPAKASKPKSTPKAASPTAAPTPAPAEPSASPTSSPTSVTSELTPGGNPEGEPLELDGGATFLASGLNLVAGAIDYTGGLLKQVELWQGLAGLGVLVMAFESSRAVVRRRQLRTAPAGDPPPEADASNDILP